MVMLIMIMRMVQWNTGSMEEHLASHEYQDSLQFSNKYGECKRMGDLQA